MSFGEAGKVIDAVAAGAEVKAGQPLATLEAYAKVEKDLADVRDRLGYYQKQAEAATAKNDAAGAKAANDKVEEKKKLLAELETRAGKLRLVAPGPGVVEKALVKAGVVRRAKDGVRLLADGELKAKLSFEIAGASKAAVEKVEKAGGSIKLPQKEAAE